MERITTDPGTLQCPDFTLQDWAAPRDEIIADNPNTTHASAAAILAVGWKAANNEQKRRWAAQVVADQQAEQARADEQQAQELKDEEDKERRRTDAAEEERKKYKQKFVPIPDRPLSVDFVIHSIAESARTTLRKCEFVELYFFTPLGIQAALANPRRMLDASSIGQDENGNLVVTSKADQQAAKGLVQDDDLSMEQFCLATPVFLQQAALAGWPEDRLNMFAQLWGALQNHHWRWHPDPLRVRALIKYQAVQRRQWHVAMLTPGQGYSLALVNEAILSQTYEDLYCEERRLKDAARDAQLYRKYLHPREPRPTLTRPSFFFPRPLPITSRTRVRCVCVPITVVPRLARDAPLTLACDTPRAPPRMNCAASPPPGAPHPLRCDQPHLTGPQPYTNSARHHADERRDGGDSRRSRGRGGIARRRSASPEKSRGWRAHDEKPNDRDGRGSRRRSPSPSRNERRRSRDRRGGFPGGTGDSVTPVCAVCLGRQPGHDMRKCQAAKLWDGSGDTFSTRTANGHLVSKNGHAPLCLDWQRPDGCPAREHGTRHRCSGCGDVAHGATRCRGAQSG